MRSPIFKKDDFVLCRVPVPHGYPQSQTHAGVFYYSNKFYLTCSPYPVQKKTRFWAYIHLLIEKLTRGKLWKEVNAESYENPMLYMGDTSEGSEPPVSFRLLSPSPLIETPKPIFGLPAYNSDPDIFIEKGDVHILNRTYYRKKTVDRYHDKIVIISLIKGKLDNDEFHFQGVEEFKRSDESLISPCLIKYRDSYLLSYLETNSAIDGYSFGGLYLVVSDTIQGLKEERKRIKVSVDSGDMLPWHMSLFNYDERLYSVISCVKKGNRSHIWQMLGVFSQDLTKLSLFSKPLTDFNSYRGSAVVVNNSFVLYSTTVYEKIKNSKSVDGRDIVMAKMPMDDLLKEMQEGIANSHTQ